MLHRTACSKEHVMAIFHFSAKVLSRSKGHHAVMAAAYRSGSRLTCERTGLVFNFTRKSEVEYLAILAPEGAPDWPCEGEGLGVFFVIVPRVHPLSRWYDEDTKKNSRP